MHCTGAGQVFRFGIKQIPLLVCPQQSVLPIPGLDNVKTKRRGLIKALSLKLLVWDMECSVCVVTMTSYRYLVLVDKQTFLKDMA